ncbi:transcription accessory protein [Acetivibrio straminisolvens JCM 21531]|uniref:Transcription accessory protein n=1 Tax=Acetivibrio straminisolvens JCM 21531 TaxID=1294263 RepID=W4V9Z5_9FIRM|nr:transcription accessory protein [Acetivibrio straminisolvens JCM 21531]
MDVGVHQDGLVHISELSDKYVRNPMDVVSVGDIVKVRILDVDVERKRISMSMKDVN